MKNQKKHILLAYPNSKIMFLEICLTIICVLNIVIFALIYIENDKTANAQSTEIIIIEKEPLTTSLLDILNQDLLKLEPSKPVEETPAIEEPVTLIIETQPTIVDSDNSKITRYDDLATIHITEEELTYIIDQFDKITGGTPFKGNAHIFMEASELSGLSPLYLFAHASLETGYGKSNLAVSKGNYFGIGAYDSNPSHAYRMGDTMRDGIVNGAIWIRENFYDNEQTTLHDMIHKYENHYYASSGDTWINDILWIMNKYTI